MKFNLETFLNIKKWYFVTGIKKKAEALFEDGKKRRRF